MKTHDDLSAMFRVLVSPAAGRLRYLPPQRFTGGEEMVEAGQPIARLEHGGGELMLHAPVAGRVSAILGLEGEPLRPGQAVVAIEPSDG